MISRTALVALACAAAIPVQGLAWGSAGHTMINRLAAQTLPASLPPFVRAASAVDEIAALGPEEDRIKGAGASWDGDNDPAHFLDLDDDGSIAGSVRLDALPPTMAGYAQALERAGTTPYKAGYLPYAIADGFERVRKDFAYWRVDEYMTAHALTAQARAAFAADRALRQDLTLRDIGEWGHFVGDGSQPLHVTVHFNGWGAYPNPQHFTNAHVHAPFETAFVERYARAEAVRNLMPAYVAVNPSALLSQEQIATITARYLSGTSAQVAPLYRLYAAGAFRDAAPDAVRFTDAALARGAQTFRDLIALAWEDSLNQSVGYPAIDVRSILSGKVAPAHAGE